MRRYFRLLFDWELHGHDVKIESTCRNHQILSARLNENWSAASNALLHHVLGNHPVLSQTDGFSGRGLK
jgi:hypothetical protein